MSLTNPKASYWSLLCLTGALLCLPLIFTSYTPLVDYPNHLARAYILYSYDRVPAYGAQYLVAFEPLPNLALDLIVPLLLHFFGLLTAGKIFLCLTVLLFVAGCHPRESIRWSRSHRGRSRTSSNVPSSTSYTTRPRSAAPSSPLSSQFRGSSR